MRLVFWTLSRFAVPPELIGDISEDYAEHRSLPRLTRQVAIAAAGTTGRTLKSDPKRILAALVIGWLLHFTHPLQILLWRVFRETFLWSLRPYSIFIGFTVGRVYNVQPVGAAIVFKTTYLIYKYLTWPPNTRFHRIDEAISLLAMIVGALLVAPRPVRATATPTPD